MIHDDGKLSFTEKHSILLLLLVAKWLAPSELAKDIADLAQQIRIYAKERVHDPNPAA